MFLESRLVAVSSRCSETESPLIFTRSHLFDPVLLIQYPRVPRFTSRRRRAASTTAEARPEIGRRSPEKPFSKPVHGWPFLRSFESVCGRFARGYVFIDPKPARKQNNDPLADVARFLAPTYTTPGSSQSPTAGRGYQLPLTFRDVTMRGDTNEGRSRNPRSRRARLRLFFVGESFPSLALFFSFSRGKRWRVVHPEPGEDCRRTVGPKI